MLSDDAADGFSAYQSAEAITYGVCHVFVPVSHRPGSLGSPWWRRWWTGQDDRLKLTRTLSLEREVFWGEVAESLQHWWPAGQRNIFVYIHGFNVDFEEAAIRAAQLGYDLKVPGEMAFFSWPSRGGTGDYMADEATITSTTPYLAQFLRELSERTGAERVHIFVHSMGNRGLLSALERIRSDGGPDLQFGQIFFCAPDEDVRTFRDKTTKFPHRFENRTLLVSPEDKAVASSRWLRDLDRVGFVPPVRNYDKIETIEVGGFGMLELGHGYFAEAEPVILDMREAIETRRVAAEREIPRPFQDHYFIDVRKVDTGRGA
jgi:esterase/lipase superfamily enzyme